MDGIGKTIGGAIVARLRRQTVKDRLRATVKRDYSPARPSTEEHGVVRSLIAA